MQDRRSSGRSELKDRRFQVRSWVGGILCLVLGCLVAVGMSGCSGGGDGGARTSVVGGESEIEQTRRQVRRAEELGGARRLVRLQSRVSAAPVFARPGSDLLLVHEPSEPIPPRSVWMPRIDGPPMLSDGTALRSLTFALVPEDEQSARTSTQDWLGGAFRYRPMELSSIASDPEGALRVLSGAPAIVWVTLIEMPGSVDHISTPLRLSEDVLDSPGLSRGVQAFTIGFAETGVPVRLLPEGTWAGPVASAGLTESFSKGLAELEAAERRSVLAESLFKAAKDPLRRWRLELLADTRGDLELGRLGLADVDDPRLARLARATAARWRLAVNRLAQTNPELAQRFVSRLTAVCEAPSGAWLPMWPAPSIADRQVLDTLSDPGAPAIERERAVRDWLSEFPSFIGTVLTQSGGTGSGVVIGVVDVAGEGGSVDVRSLAFRPARLGFGGAFRSGRVSLVSLPNELGDDPLAEYRAEPAARASAQVLLTSGRGTATIGAAADPVPVVRPGFTGGPFVGGWTRETLYGNTVPRVARSEATMIAVRRDSDGAWWVHVESNSPREGDVVTVYMDELSVALVPAGEDLTRAAWTASVRVPESVVSDGVMRLAATRSAPGMRRLSWPYAMFPLQAEPGLVALDLGKWAGPVFGEGM